MSKLSKKAQVISFLSPQRSKGAVFTLRSRRTGNHYTYKVIKKRNKRSGYVFFIYAMVGRDNQEKRDYEYIGCVFGTHEGTCNDLVKRTPKSRLKTDDAIVKALFFFWNKILVPSKNDTVLNDAIEFHHIGRCGRCNRPLTTPASVETGLGPDCARQLGVPHRVSNTASGVVGGRRGSIPEQTTTFARNNGVLMPVTIVSNNADQSIPESEAMDPHIQALRERFNGTRRQRRELQWEERREERKKQTSVTAMLKKIMPTIGYLDDNDFEPFEDSEDETHFEVGGAAELLDYDN